MISQVLVGVVALAEEGPAPEDVKAGWPALLLFLGLAIAVAFLCWSLVRQLRKAQRAKEAGVYGDEPEGDSSDE